MRKKIYLFSILALGLVPSVSAQSTTSEASVFSNPLFLAMAVMSLVLLFIVLVLTNVVLSSIKTKIREKKASKNINVVATALLMISAFSANAQEATKSLYEATPITGIHPWSFYILFAIIITELFVIFWLCLVVLRIVSKAEEKSAVEAGEVVKKENAFAKFFSRKVLGVMPVETDKDLLLDHDYDGIQELDNDLPPWWKYGFYLTIVMAIVYFVGYHVTGTFKSSLQEYETELADAEKAVSEYRTKMALNVDETNVVFLTEADKLSAGQAVYVKNCAVCHGNEGQGTIGPNFADNYWIYGGHAKDMFVVVKNGAKNGMKAWKDELTPTEMQNVISYIHSLKGTNPANPKAPQGDLFEDGATTSDTTSSVLSNAIDSIKIIETK
ncbi:MAG: cbb3-type cytochrome c oxidase N-terminal domain-containing protein [Bacteroidota bacterium]|nr:cbb3-type cytochrome c oxidase N-terminal domain-containing protein [Bacteroidota bacterium]